MTGQPAMEKRPVLLEDTVVSCSYLPGKIFRSENFLYPDVSAELLDKLLAGGYRHFGYYFFRPFCGRCHQCIPLRVPVEKFVPGASFRRILSRNKDVEVILQRPAPSEEAFSIYKKHKKRFRDQGVEAYRTFLSSFFYSFDFSYQLSMKKEGKLVGIAHLDITDLSLSCIYSYYDTDYESDSPGTFSILKSLEIARAKSIPHVYLGYYVNGCRHMNYKIRFRPNQALVKEGEWRDFTGDSNSSIPPALVKRGFRPKKRFSSQAFDG